MPHPALVPQDHPVLRNSATPVPKDLFGSDKLRTILARMSETLRAEEHGVAIAAPQIGEPYRIFMVRGYIIAGTERNDTDPDVVFINPSMTRHSRKKELMDEGCLSVPGVYGKTERSVRATVRAQDATGKKFERGGADLLAQIFQHEIDHLNGILFIDHAIDTHTSHERKQP